jgi:putative membrane protein
VAATLAAVSSSSGDPDSRARTHLANERTFLAWFRTGVTLIALGVAAGQLLIGTGFGLSRLLALGVVGTGIALLIIGRARYKASRERIDAGTFRPARSSVNFSVAVFVLAGLVAAIFVLFVER